MPAHHDDVRRTLEYGQSHDMARSALPWTLGAIAFGLFILAMRDGGSSDGKDTLLAGIVIAGALVFLGVLTYRRAQPSVPQLALSEQGIVFRQVSEKLIPWDEIRAVTRDTVSGSKDFFSTKVVRLEVSPQFYERYVQGHWLESVTGSGGDPSAIYLAYYLDVPHDELVAAVQRRWLAFSSHAEGTSRAEGMIDCVAPTTASHDDASPLSGFSTFAMPRRSRVIERASSFEGVQALAGLVHGASWGQLLANTLAIAAIVTIATNLLGYWATEAQLKGRAEAAKWKAWHAERDREQREFDEQQERNREKFDRMYKCMDETFKRRDLGISGEPECAKNSD